MSTRRKRSRHAVNRKERARLTRLASIEERKAFFRDPANVMRDELWPPVADCGYRHHGACCSEPVCCVSLY